MKITFLISSLTAGGAERVVTVLADEWARHGHDVMLMTYDSEEHKPHYPLSHSVVHRPLDLLKTSEDVFSFIRQNIVRIKTIRQELRDHNPDVVVSFMTEVNLLLLLATRGMTVPVIISERVHPEYHRIRKIDKFFRKLTYRWASSLVVQTEDIKRWFKEELLLESTILPNPIHLDSFLPPDTLTFPTPEVDTGLITAVGRLDEQKGFDVMIDAFSQISKKYPMWNIKIYGDGASRQALQTQITKLGLDGRIELCGAVVNVSERLWECDIFVHAARYEGFPNVIIEALAAGCCVISTDGPTAADELLQDGVFGELVENGNAEKLAIGISALIENPSRRSELRSLASNSIKQFSASKVAQEWLKHIGTFVRE